MIAEIKKGLDEILNDSRRPNRLGLKALEAKAKAVVAQQAPERGGTTSCAGGGQTVVTQSLYDKIWYFLDDHHKMDKSMWYSGKVRRAFGGRYYGPEKLMVLRWRSGGCFPEAVKGICNKRSTTRFRRDNHNSPGAFVVQRGLP